MNIFINIFIESIGGSQMPRSFSKIEKENIRQELIDACKKSWSIYGYRKTSVSELCAEVGISTGSFYSFYDTKEALFCDMMDDFQNNTRMMYDEMLSSPPKKEEIAEVLKKLYLEYAQNNIITKRYSSDYKSLINKLPKEWKEKHHSTSKENLDHSLFAPGIKLKMEKDKAHRIIDTLLLTVVNKEIYDDHYDIFCTLLDCVINEIYE